MVLATKLMPSLVKGTSMGFSDDSGSNDRVGKLRVNDLARWRWVLASAGFSLFFSLLLIGIGLSEADNTSIVPVGTFGALTAALGLYRLRILQPKLDSMGRAANYAAWRKAMQKPLEAAVGLPLILVLMAATQAAESLYPGADARSSMVTSFALGLFAWSALAGLVGSAGADAASLLDGVHVPAVSEECTTVVWMACISGVFFAAKVCGPHLPGAWRIAPWVVCGAVVALFIASFTWGRTPQSRAELVALVKPHSAWWWSTLIMMILSVAWSAMFTFALPHHPGWKAGTEVIVVAAGICIFGACVLNPGMSLRDGLHELPGQIRDAVVTLAGAPRHMSRPSTPAWVKNWPSIALAFCVLAIFTGIGWTTPTTTPSPTTTSTPSAPASATCTLITPSSTANASAPAATYECRPH